MRNRYRKSRRALQRRSLWIALSNLGPDPDVHEALLGQVDLDDVRAAARIRLDSLAAVGISAKSPR